MMGLRVQSNRPFRSRRAGAHVQRGAVLAVGLIALVLITLIVVGAFNFTQSNQKIIYNTQVKEEAVSAAQAAIERLISTDFTVGVLSGTRPQTVQIDINNDTSKDYTVTFDVPVCVRAVPTSVSQVSEIELGNALQTSAYWTTDWNLRAVVEDASTGARATIVQGVRLYQSEAQKNAACN